MNMNLRIPQQEKAIRTKKRRNCVRSSEKIGHGGVGDDDTKGLVCVFQAPLYSRCKKQLLASRSSFLSSFRTAKHDTHRTDLHEISYLRFSLKFVGIFRFRLKSAC